MIKNKTKNTIICNDEKLLKDVFSKAIGLMFSKKIKDMGYIFFFEKAIKVDLHMFFVFFPIDIIFLDADKKVIELKENFMPFTFYLSKKKAKYVIELPSGSIKESKTGQGDILYF